MYTGTILLVDDEEELLKSMDFLLSDLVETRLRATNGIEALEVLNSTKVDCIICDINMPQMNGLELIKKVREIDEKVPFIFYTGHGTRELMLEVVKYGVFDFLNKPNIEGIEESVKRAFELSDPTKSDLKLEDLLKD